LKLKVISTSLQYLWETVLTFWSNRDPILTAHQLMTYSSAINR